MHPTARLHCATGGTLTEMDLPAYLGLVRGRPSPASRGDARHDRILSVDVTAPAQYP